MPNKELAQNRPAKQAAAKSAFAKTVRGNVYAQLGMIHTPEKISEMRKNAARLDIKGMIKKLQSEI